MNHHRGAAPGKWGIRCALGPGFNVDHNGQPGCVWQLSQEVWCGNKHRRINAFHKSTTTRCASPHLRREPWVNSEVRERLGREVQVWVPQVTPVEQETDPDTGLAEL